ncbi:MAG: FadR family transcriptional regulator [Pelotomaculum sp.]|nr:FadR family transcriptional regulator [Pelotomaculum sp.]
MNLKPVKTKKVYEEIIEQVKNLIADGTLKPGDRLIPEREMADRLQVGRSAVREAYRALEAMGIIDIRQGEGTFIKEVNTDMLAETLALMLATEKNTMREFLELRKILEVGAAGLAALRCTDEEVIKMAGALAQMEEDIKAGDVGQQADWQFHYAIAEATRNSLLVLLMDSIRDTMSRLLKEARDELYRTPGTPQRLLKEHYEIFEAVKNGHDVKAQKAMYDHLDRVEKALFP